MKLKPKGERLRLGSTPSPLVGERGEGGVGRLHGRVDGSARLRLCGTSRPPPPTPLHWGEGSRSRRPGRHSLFHQTFDDLTGREQGLSVLAVEPGDGLGEPRELRVLAALAHGRAFGGEHDIHLAAVGRMRLALD